jgi:glutamine amidotransferase
MCELFGFSSAEATDIRGYLKTFYSHSVRHPHGWGIMRETETGFEIIKEPRRATGSRIISNVISTTRPQRNLLAHIRLATVGGMKEANCHPYSGIDSSGRCWTLIHNGTIYSGMQLTRYLSKQKGDTDSERVFLYLMDEVNAAISQNNGAPLSESARCNVVESIATALSPRNKLNLIIFDGDLMYVHKNMKNTLYTKRVGTGIIFSTAPLDDGEWESYPTTTLCAYKNGERIFTGTKHDGVFIPNLEYINAMAAMNI